MEMNTPVTGFPSQKQVTFNQAKKQANQSQQNDFF